MEVHVFLCPRLAPDRLDGVVDGDGAFQIVASGFV